MSRGVMVLVGRGFHEQRVRYGDQNHGELLQEIAVKTSIGKHGERNSSEIVIYETGVARLSLPLDLEHETVWASPTHIGEHFGINQSCVSRHVCNVFRDE